MPWSIDNWPPTREDFFRGSLSHRPIYQGDVFKDVPYVKGQAGDRPGSEPRVSVERRVVVALSYPCEMYSNGILTRVQTIAVVREGDKLRIPPDWFGAFYACPLPDLFRDGKTWGLDFRTMSNVDRSFLTPANRVNCLTEYAWAFLRQRMATYFTRVSCHLDDLRDAGKAAWDEVELWERWCALGRRAEDYQAWLDERDVNIGSSRRQALQRGMTRLVASAM